MDTRYTLLKHYSEEQVQEYEEYLDSEGDIVIGSLSYPPSLVLERVDPIAYKVGMDEFANLMGW